MGVRRMATTPKKMLRILLAGGLLAAAWVAVDLVTSADSAAAAPSSDLIPDVVTDTVSAVTTPLGAAVAPITTPVAEPVVDTLSSATAPVVAPVASTLAPVIAPIATPVVTSVVKPLEPAVSALTEPLAPVAHAAIDPFLPAIAPLIPVVAPLVTVVEPLASVVVIVDAVDVLPGLPRAAVTPNTTLLGGGLVLLSGAVGASVIQLLPLQGNSPSPRQAPQAPTGSTSPVLFADLAFAYPVSAASALTALPATEVIPASPTFASDTTPD
jgi:hypothetical protein